MENNPTAAGEASQAPQTEANPQTTNTEPVQTAPQAPDMHGFTSEQLAEMRKFYDANGGFEKVKSKISNPEKPAELAGPTQAESQKAEEPVKAQGTEPAYKTPAGAITASEFLAEQYFKSLASEEKYATISDGIRNGDYLKEMSAFGIQALNQDGSINDQKVRMYLDLKAQTVPAKPTETEPNASSAPTVDYVNIGDKIENLDQAYQVIMQPGHPRAKDAEEFIKSHLNQNFGK